MELLMKLLVIVCSFSSVCSYGYRFSTNPYTKEKALWLHVPETDPILLTEFDENKQKQELVQSNEIGSNQGYAYSQSEIVKVQPIYAPDNQNYELVEPVTVSTRSKTSGGVKKKKKLVREREELAGYDQIPVFQENAGTSNFDRGNGGFNFNQNGGVDRLPNYNTGGGGFEQNSGNRGFEGGFSNTNYNSNRNDRPRRPLSGPTPKPNDEEGYRYGPPMRTFSLPEAPRPSNPGYGQGDEDRDRNQRRPRPPSRDQDFEQPFRPVTNRPPQNIPERRPQRPPQENFDNRGTPSFASGFRPERPQPRPPQRTPDFRPEPPQRRPPPTRRPESERPPPTRRPEPGRPQPGYNDFDDTASGTNNVGDGDFISSPDYNPNAPEFDNRPPQNIPERQPQRPPQENFDNRGTPSFASGFRPEPPQRRPPPTRRPEPERSPPTRRPEPERPPPKRRPESERSPPTRRPELGRPQPGYNDFDDTASGTNNVGDGDFISSPDFNPNYAPEFDNSPVGNNNVAQQGGGEFDNQPTQTRPSQRPSYANDDGSQNFGNTFNTNSNNGNPEFTNIGGSNDRQRPGQRPEFNFNSNSGSGSGTRNRPGGPLSSSESNSSFNRGSSSDFNFTQHREFSFSSGGNSYNNRRTGGDGDRADNRGVNYNPSDNRFGSGTGSGGQRGQSGFTFTSVGNRGGSSGQRDYSGSENEVRGQGGEGSRGGTGSRGVYSLDRIPSDRFFGHSGDGTNEKEIGECGQDGLDEVFSHRLGKCINRTAKRYGKRRVRITRKAKMNQ